MKIVVSDTSPIINLAMIGRLALLQASEFLNRFMMRLLKLLGSSSDAGFMCRPDSKVSPTLRGMPEACACLPSLSAMPCCCRACVFSTKRK
jgi:hypothetical protein